VRGIRNLRALGQPVLTNTVIVRSNMRNAPAIARLLVSLDVQQFQFAYVHPVGTAGGAADGEGITTVVPRFEIAAPYLARGLQVGRDAGVPCCTEAVPYCVLPGAVVDDYRAYRRHEGKLKGPECPACRWFELCEGPWREYPQTYGFGELRPVPPDAPAAVEGRAGASATGPGAGAGGAR
jgi:hypothetical protein